MVTVSYFGRSIKITFTESSNLTDIDGIAPLSPEEIMRLENAQQFWNEFIPKFFASRRIAFTDAYFDERAPFTVDVCTGLNMEQFPELFRGTIIYGIHSFLCQHEEEVKVKVVIGKDPNPKSN